MIGYASFLRSWQVPGTGGDIFIVLGRDVRPDTRIASVPPGLPAQIDSWLANPVLQPRILEMYQAVGGTLTDPAHPPNQSELRRYVKPRLLDAFRLGELLIMPAARAPAGGGEAEPPRQQGQQTGTQTSAQSQKTWIEIELVDAQGKPVPNERYRIQAPDGQFHTGQLDSSDRARISGIDPGECLVCFPDIDAREWGPAASQ